MRLIRMLVASAFLLLVPVLAAAPAGATIDGPCTASGTIDGKTYDASPATAKIPRQGDVAWNGAISRDASGPREIEGKVYLKLPPPWSKVVIADGDWDGPSSRAANRGTYHYDLPSVLVGPKATLYGHHAERGSVVCTGTIEVQLDGSVWSNPALLASLGLTVLALINFALMLRVKEGA
jgi:hypothetical protein